MGKEIDHKKPLCGGLKNGGFLFSAAFPWIAICYCENMKRVRDHDNNRGQKQKRKKQSKKLSGKKESE